MRRWFVVYPNSDYQGHLIDRARIPDDAVAQGSQHQFSQAAHGSQLGDAVRGYARTMGQKGNHVYIEEVGDGTVNVWYSALAPLPAP
jgi:hypothetical protein